MRALLTAVSATLALLCTLPAWAADVYQAPEDFVREAFGGTPPPARKLWLTKSLRPTVAAILGHAPPALRVRYWLKERRSVWILEEIGKEQPITTGLIVNDGAIEGIKVLIYRESRGFEVKHPFFTDQFKDARLTAERRLDRNIDGISGATLSVRALKKLARVALFLHQAVAADHDAP